MQKNDRKTLKSDLVRKAFAETAKAIIVKEGYEGVSIRRIAEQTGYTYATIYNHFRGIDELLWLVRDLLIREIIQYMEIHGPKEVSGINDVRASFVTYAAYFTAKPQVFRFFYFRKLDPQEKPQGAGEYASALEAKVHGTFAFLQQSEQFTSEEIPMLIKILITSIHGMLTLALSENDTLSITDIPSEIDGMFRYLFENPRK
ncbi:TetR/AcrR family transcriptional regulator [Spirochaeta lutea]|uniref:HTH tetR-type domain-containing protein n=1 Tax=Spirochaeta lutea TaxID=1480694 RepID=A0A098QY99_9SPIO|nr:TetR/AcrR family transcriptional regulator [Spirochaeta lutea]KGE72398.1 hypothetical protein DC28_06910 [Spirochaeta lutea]